MIQDLQHLANQFLFSLPRRYQFNPHLLRDEPVTNILTKALTVFPSPDFSLCAHLLPSYILSPPSSSNNPSSNPTPGDAPLSEAVQKLTILNNLLSGAKYREFWQTLDKDDLYADLIADVGGFEELMRVRIAVTVGQSCREVERGVLEGWCMSWLFLVFSPKGRGRRWTGKSSIADISGYEQ